MTHPKTTAASSGTLSPHLEPIRFMRLAEVRLAVGLSTATIYKYIEAGRFPRGVLLSPRCRRWPASEISAWLLAGVSQ